MSCEDLPLYVGIKGPHFLEITVSRMSCDDAPPDFTTCTEARLLVRFNKNTAVEEWTLDIDEDKTTETELVVTHTFAEDGSEVPRAGELHFQVLYTLDPGGELMSAPGTKTIASAP